LKDQPSEIKRMQEKQEDNLVDEISRAIELERINVLHEDQRVKEGKGIGFRMRISEFNR
jgi:hypothetical protein